MPYVSAVLTAAGESSRMGSLKALLSWRGVKLVEYQVQSLIAGGANEVVVVLGYEYDKVIPYIAGVGVECVVNQEYRNGRAASIRTGLAKISSKTDAIVILGVDQPRPPELVSLLIQSQLRSDKPITMPSFEGQGGHPVIFSSALRNELSAISEKDQGLRRIVESYRGMINRVYIENPIVRLDLNTPEEYANSKRTYGS